MAANRENLPVAGDDRELVHLRTAVTNMEQRFNDFAREMREAIAAISQAPQPIPPRRAGVVPPAPPANPNPQPQRRRNEPQHHGGRNQRPADSSSEEEIDFEDPIEIQNQRNNPRHHTHEYKLKMDIPAYDGRVDIEFILDWIQSTEHFFEYMQIPESKQVSLVAYKLKAGAAAWWEQVQFNRRRQGKQPIRTWYKMKQHIRDRFLPSDYEHQLYKQYQDCNQRNRTVTEYVDEFYRLNARNNLQETEIQLVSRFLNGLKDQIRNELILHTLWTPSDAVTIPTDNSRSSSSEEEETDAVASLSASTSS